MNDELKERKKAAIMVMNLLDTLGASKGEEVFELLWYGPSLALRLVSS